MAGSQSFSKQHGYSIQPKDITTREDAPKDFRFALLEITREIAHRHLGQYPETGIRDVVANSLRRWLDPSVWRYQDAWEQVEKAVYGCDWFRVYDLVEAFHGYFRGAAPIASAEFRDEINGVLIEQGIGWQLGEEGNVVTRGDEGFENAVKTAATVLEQDDKPTAAGRLRFAIAALSSKPSADTSGAVSHATSAVECVLGEITGEALTLGAYLNKHPNLFHPALRTAIDKIYGYACDEGARHGKEGTEPGRDEAEFVLATCAAACTLLTRKRPK